MANSKNTTNNNTKRRTQRRRMRRARVLPSNTYTRNDRPVAQQESAIRSSENRPVVFTGSDFLQKVTLKPNSAITQPSDRILSVFEVSPSAYTGTRLTQLAALWERYRFLIFLMRYITALPTTVASQLMLYIDTDPTDDPSVIPDVDALIRQAASQAGSRQWNASQNQEIHIVQRKDDQLYYTGAVVGQSRFSLQGRAYLIQVTDPVNFNGQYVTTPLDAGTLYMDWRCLFQTPQINPSAIVPTAQDSLTATAISIPLGDGAYVDTNYGTLELSQPTALFAAGAQTSVPYGDPLAPGSEFKMRFTHAPADATKDFELDWNIEDVSGAGTTTGVVIRSPANPLVQAGVYGISVTKTNGDDVPGPQSNDGNFTLQAIGLASQPAPIYTPPSV